MADKDLVTYSWTLGLLRLCGLFSPLLVLIGIVVVVGSCIDPTTSVSVTRQRDTLLVIDTVQTIHVDTVLVFHTDSIFIYCYEIDHNRDGHSAVYACDDGTVGPRQ